MYFIGHDTQLRLRPFYRKHLYIAKSSEKKIISLFQHIIFKFQTGLFIAKIGKII